MEVLFEPIRYGDFSFSLIGVIIVGIILIFFIIPAVIESIVENIKKSKKIAQMEKELTSKHGNRIDCVDCPYCKKYVHRPFYTLNDLSYWAPIYCKKFKIKFTPGQLGQKCQAKDPEKAIREDYLSKHQFDK